VESIGIERAKRVIKEADLVLLVLDSSEPLREEDREIISLIGDKKVIAILNKKDLPRRIDDKEIPFPKVEISALKGEGLEELWDRMEKEVLGGVMPSDAPVITNARHMEALRKAKEHLERAVRNIDEGAYEELITIDLSEALNSIGEITGENVSEDLLNTIFSRFCVGK